MTPEKAKTMKIPLTRGHFALVDSADYAEMSQHNWYCSSCGYARRDTRKGGSRLNEVPK